MEHVIALLVGRYESGELSRRQLIHGLGLAFAARLPPRADAVNIASINHVSMQVSDIDRSVAFYTRTFGLVSERSNADTARLASGRCHVSLRRGAPVGIDHFAFGVDVFDQDAVTAELSGHGLEPQTDSVFGFHVLDPDGVRVQITENDERHR